ncbi:MAG: undecaprenyldiphospho-muramoylpentapeptide beta-N-acetylglucosaminyltransferase [Sphingopyxis sp.]|nr:undecaprenyldiphospho-muramoylpentapeptide beta-N-acetylglucosaminyltransferase [Sphingopyxis sp.]
MSVSRHYVLAAGGRGGHMLPAYALAAELLRRGHQVALITDDRGTRIPGAPEAMEVHVLPAGRLSGGPIGWVRAANSIRKGRSQAKALMRDFKPSAVVGFGGYPSFPGLLAAKSLGIPALLHEQNAVLGRVNRLMAPRVAAIAVAYSDIHRMPSDCADKVHLVGNPVRDAFVEIRNAPYPLLGADGILRLLIVGGSLGATVLGEVVPQAIAMLPPNLLSRLQVVQQGRADDVEATRARYAELGVAAECATYFADMPDRIRWAHLFIGRAGASTVAELSCAGRPAIFVPFPGAVHDHQSHNVRDLVAAGGARAIPQPQFTPAELAKQIQKLALETGALAAAAERARSCGRPDATRDLADLVESTGGAPMMDVIRVGASTSKARAAARPAGATKEMAE